VRKLILFPAFDLAMVKPNWNSKWSTASTFNRLVQYSSSPGAAPTVIQNSPFLP